VILVMVLRRRLGGSILQGMVSSIAKTAVATVLMGIVTALVLALMRNLPDDFWFNILRLAVVVPAAAAVYLLAAKILHIEMLSLLTGGTKDSNIKI